MKLGNVIWSTDTAGPSPDYNKRTEIFLYGCKRAAEGSPCKGCFNNIFWDSSKINKEYDPKEIAYQVYLNAPNKYITIGGGEPTDQLDELIILCKELKKYGFHIIIYTWRNLLKILKNDFQSTRLPRNSKYYNSIDVAFKTLLKYLDIVIDGEFKIDEKLYNENAGDGTFSSVGSGNQTIWDVSKLNHIRGNKLKDIEYLAINSKNNKLYYIKKQGGNING